MPVSPTPWPNQNWAPAYAFPTTSPFLEPGTRPAFVKIEEDAVDQPAHYTQALPGEAEPIHFLRHLNFCRGSAAKYLVRAGRKGGPEKEIQDLEKAIKFIRFEIERVKLLAELGEQ